jgi:hypothetical protein
MPLTTPRYGPSGDLGEAESVIESTLISALQRIARVDYKAVRLVRGGWRVDTYNLLGIEETGNRLNHRRPSAGPHGCLKML